MKLLKIQKKIQKKKIIIVNIEQNWELKLVNSIKKIQIQKHWKFEKNIENSKKVENYIKFEIIENSK